MMIGKKMLIKKIIVAINILLFSTLFFDHGKADSEMGHHAHMHGPIKKCGSAEKHSNPTITLSVIKIDKKKGKDLVQIKLSTVKNNQPITLNDLKVIHTEKIHLLIIDDALEDYSHIHPVATKEPGVYEFEWAPKHTGKYLIWADLFLLESNAQEYVVADLTPGKSTPSKIDQTISLYKTIDDLNFDLSFNPKVLRACEPTSGTIDIHDNKGNPVKNLEPIMGAFAHIVGFGDDLKTVIHIHPMGKEPTNDSDRGGPELKFHIVPKTTGFIKIFVQLRINGKEIFVPFSVLVSPQK